ncbi:M23 family metallopeptidase [Pseudochrobactrum algeriensis]|uniref:M23 family metallopeptidase n=1 Tax=Pseudochrobactrum algeriensis TaxID=2834768 RepID=UPI001BCEFE0F|nr:M23 family metallopeptidase [Pseudochrobactrum algeriensis]MBX8814061.1 M23 family metallopeptidase [Ochrobactrum sp. MR34]QVQ36345.1 M23 family metallopeptidase [Pseudochrobactrum algeriensis]QVQ39564.1 M23 family metallopeptidase [Pseudochrobactrum algeriensis]QVQ43483.1 M23 family metallopeptidase [Pseudochrobactrum algeriensis]
MNQQIVTNSSDPGDEPPLITDGRRGPPDRREVSARWLAGTFLTGITASLLIGVALFAALDGRQQLATPPELVTKEEMPAKSDAQDSTKGNRVIATVTKQKSRDRRRMEVSTMQKVGEREVIRTKPFEYVRMALAADHPASRQYPAFDAMAVFSDGAKQQVQAASTGQIYGAKVESEISLRTIDFPVNAGNYDSASDLTSDEVEKVVRSTGQLLTDGDVQIASLHYVDPLRFGNSGDSPYTLTQPLGVRITQENVSVSNRLLDGETNTGFSEDIIPFRSDSKIIDALNKSGYEGEDADNIAEALSKLMNSPRLKAGSVLRVGVTSSEEEDHIVRVTLYNGTTHIVTVALDDQNQYVPSDEPEMTPLLQTAFDDNAPPPTIRGELPSVYDAVYKAALAYGMTNDMARQLIKMLANDVDLQSKITRSDAIEAFFSLPEDSESANEESQLLYVSANMGGTTKKFYRYQSPEGGVEFYDENGRSAQQFLIRKPVPNGVFGSPFGGRRHPILGYVRMHTGVDWRAPRGSPILAAGNGVVEKAGWANGYGNQTIIRHGNGYQTSYNHQNAIASGITPGARVRQGQLIGYVGSTGLSTGPHLHYEVIVNGAKVDPMRIRMPQSQSLGGKQLEVFTRERNRIDQLLDGKGDAPAKVANTSQAKS